MTDTSDLIKICNTQAFLLGVAIGSLTEIVNNTNLEMGFSERHALYKLNTHLIRCVETLHYPLDQNE